MNPAKTPAQRQAEHKNRQIVAGLVQLKRWVHPDDALAIKALADEMQRKRSLNPRQTAKAGE